MVCVGWLSVGPSIQGLWGLRVCPRPPVRPSAEFITSLLAVRGSIWLYVPFRRCWWLKARRWLKSRLPRPLLAVLPGIHPIRDWSASAYTTFAAWLARVSKVVMPSS